jgi:hypothetical protein
MAFKMKGFNPGKGTGMDKAQSSFKLRTNKKIDGKRVKKTDSGRIEGEILGIYDNEYNEAKQDKDLKRIKQLEKRMLKLRNTVVKRGDGELFTKNKSHIDMSKFNSPNKMKGNKRGYDTQGADAKEEAMKKELHQRTNKRRLKEVKSSIRDLRKERIKKIGNKRAQTNLKSAIAGLKDKKKELKGKNKKKDLISPPLGIGLPNSLDHVKNKKYK